MIKYLLNSIFITMFRKLSISNNGKLKWYYHQYNNLYIYKNMLYQPENENSYDSIIEYNFT